MARPSPVPPVVRARAGSARQNRSNTSCASSGAEAAAVVPDRDRDRVPVPGHGDHHVPALAVLDRVVQQVAQDPLDAAPVHLGDARLGGQPEVDPGAAPRGQLLGVGRGPPDQVAHVGRLGVQGGRVGVVPADLQQVAEQRLEPLQLALEQFRRPGRGRQQVVARREQHVRRDPDRGQRGAQLVRHVGDELPLHLGQLLQLAQLLLQAGRHVIERPGQGGQVVGATDRHPLLELAIGQPLGRLGRFPDRHDHPPGDQRDDADQQHDQGQPATEHGPLHQGQRLLLLFHREQVVQLGTRADHTADGQPGNRRPAVQVAHLRRGGHQVVGAALLLLLGHAGDQLLGQAVLVEIPVAVDTGERGAVRRLGQDHHVERVTRPAQGLQIGGQLGQCLLLVAGRALQVRVVLGRDQALADLVRRRRPGAVQQAAGDLLDQEEAEHGGHHHTDDQGGGDHPELQRAVPAAAQPAGQQPGPAPHGAQGRAGLRWQPPGRPPHQQGQPGASGRRVRRGPRPASLLLATPSIGPSPRCWGTCRSGRPPPDQAGPAL